MSEEERWIQLIGQLFGKALGPSEYKMQNLKMRGDYKRGEAQRDYEERTREDTQQHALDVLSEEQSFQTGEREKGEEFTSMTNAVKNARRTKVGKWKNPLTKKIETLGTKLTGSSLKTAKKYGANIQEIGDESWISLQDNEILTQRITNQTNITQTDLAEAEKLKQEQIEQVRNWYIQNKEMYPQVGEDADFMHWTYDDQGNRDKYVISKEGEDLLAGNDINLYKYIDQVAEATGMSQEDVTAVLADPEFIKPILDKWNRIRASALGDLISFREFKEEAAPYLEDETSYMGAFRTLLGEYEGGSEYGLDVYGKSQSGDAKELYDIEKKNPNVKRAGSFDIGYKPGELMTETPKLKPLNKSRLKESKDVASPNPITSFPVNTFLDEVTQNTKNTSSWNRHLAEQKALETYEVGLHDWRREEWENIIEGIYQNMYGNR